MSYETMDATVIGNTLRKLRESQNLTMERLSVILGITTSAICNYETGARIPRDEVKIRIAEYFGVPVESIFFQKKQHET